MSEHIETVITDQQFQSTSDALETAKKALSAKDDELFDKAIVFYYSEISRMKFVKIGLKEANKAAEEGDWDTCRNCLENVYTSMPVTLARTWEISSVSEAKTILHILLDDEDGDIAHEGSAANLLASRALKYVVENGSREERLAVMEGANPQLYEVVTSPLGITDDGLKVIDVEACAQALEIPVDKFEEGLPESAFLPEGTEVNPIQLAIKCGLWWA